jgi:hypothetical protein
MTGIIKKGLVQDNCFTEVLPGFMRGWIPANWRLLNGSAANRPHPFFMASALISFGISSMAYRSAVRGMAFLWCITKE